jgi:putative transposase
MHVVPSRSPLVLDEIVPYNGRMNLTLQLSLVADAGQSALLLATMERFNEAATFAAKVGFDAKVYSQPSVHKLAYREIRERFGLSAQLAVRAIGKAVEAFATVKASAKGKTWKCPAFKSRGAVTYDQRNMSFKRLDKVSLATLSGRVVVPMAYGEYQRERFDRIKGQCDLVYRAGRFYLYVSVVLPDGSPVEPKDFLGVDLGIVRLATDSDGRSYSGEAVETVRRRYHHNRKRLQRKGTKGAKKALKRQSRRESNFRRHENHCISKAVVAKAKGTDRGIALEDLNGIRDRTTVRARQRAKHSGWAFFQLRSFVEYKAGLAGIPVVAVDPRNTSRTCSVCGRCDQANRKTQDAFKCLHCGFSANADLNAALNLRVRGLGSTKRPPELATNDQGWNPCEVSRKSQVL